MCGYPRRYTGPVAAGTCRVWVDVLRGGGRILVRRHGYTGILGFIRRIGYTIFSRYRSYVECFSSFIKFTFLEGQRRFPKLSAIAISVLDTPASQNKVERSFSEPVRL